MIAKPPHQVAAKPPGGHINNYSNVVCTAFTSNLMQIHIHSHLICRLNSTQFPSLPKSSCNHSNCYHSNHQPSFLKPIANFLFHAVHSSGDSSISIINWLIYIYSRTTLNGNHSSEMANLSLPDLHICTSDQPLQPSHPFNQATLSRSLGWPLQRDYTVQCRVIVIFNQLSQVPSHIHSGNL